ncbi:transglycosylase SLT domain-containing protein [Undibacterium sp. SXout11W]|uniref:transglycosylase SLT domain-containing protein n=1 Tax=Undibacterium sp. SXout11W TaxID=3413050 RepID=UPI003BF36D65
MKHFLSALLLPIIIVVALFAIACGVAKANDIPSAARQHRGDLTRIARASFGLDAPVPAFAAQLHQESGWNPGAVSTVGAKGMAQFMPATAQWWCALNKLSATDCQPTNSVWAMRALVGYDYWLMQRVAGESEFDLYWATLRSYNGGLGHWQNEAAKVRPALNHAAIDAACGRASRAKLHCPENLGYPDRILNRLQRRYAAWGRTVEPT